MAKRSIKQVKYEKPPLIEAVCEFRFAEIGIQPVLVSGSYYERVRNEFSEIEVKKGFGMTTGGPEVAMIPEERTVFRNPAANRLVQIAHGMLAINQLPPYTDYVAFRREITTRFADYMTVAQPKKLVKMGLRYINRLALPKDQNFNKVLQIGFKIPQSLRVKPNPYLLRLEFPYHDGRDRLILIVAKAPDRNEGPGVMLDLDYVLTKPEQAVEDDPMKWVDNAHEAIEDVFQACVTNEAKASFKPLSS